MLVEWPMVIRRSGLGLEEVWREGKEQIAEAEIAEETREGECLTCLHVATSTCEAQAFLNFLELFFRLKTHQAQLRIPLKGGANFTQTTSSHSLFSTLSILLPLKLVSRKKHIVIRISIYIIKRIFIHARFTNRNLFVSSSLHLYLWIWRPWSSRLQLSTETLLIWLTIYLLETWKVTSWKVGFTIMKETTPSPRVRFKPPLQPRYILSFSDLQSLPLALSFFRSTEDWVAPQVAHTVNFLDMDDSRKSSERLWTRFDLGSILSLLCSFVFAFLPSRVTPTLFQTSLRPLQFLRAHLPLMLL